MKSLFILFTTIALFTTSVWGFDLRDLIGGQPQKKFVLESTTQYSPGTEPDAKSSDELFRQKLSSKLLLFDEPKYQISTRILVDWLNPLVERPLPSNGVRIPSDLWNTKLSGNFGFQPTESSRWGFQVSVGSASDRPYSKAPFSDQNVWTLGLTGFYTWTVSESSRWVVILNYSNNRSFLNNIPLPGVAYLYTPSKQLSLTLGIPFAGIFISPLPKLLISAFVLPPRNFNLKVMYFVLGPIRLYSSLKSNTQSYLRVGRADRDDRLVYFDIQWAFGIASPLAKGISLDLSVVRSFERRYYEAERYSKREENELKLENTWFYQALLKIKF